MIILIKRKLKIIIYTITLLSFVGCKQKHRIFIANTGEQKIFNMQYGTHTRHVMDIFTPKIIDKNKPAVLIIHVGAWQFGKKEHISQIQRYLLQEGFVSFNINYRLVNKKKNITYIEQLDDINKSIEHFQQFTKNTNISYDNIVILGESAGGHLALLYGYGNVDKVSKIIALSPPTDLYSEQYRKSNYYKLSHKVFQKVVGAKYNQDNISKFRKSSPIYMAKSVPTLHFQGGRGLLVHRSQGMALDSVLNQKGINHEFVYMSKKGHVPRLFSKKFRNTILYPKILKFLKNNDNQLSTEK